MPFYLDLNVFRCWTLKSLCNIAEIWLKYYLLITYLGEILPYMGVKLPYMGVKFPYMDGLLPYMNVNFNFCIIYLCRSTRSNKTFWIHSFSYNKKI